MKRIFTLLFASMLAGQAWAEDFAIDNLTYTITGANTVSVTGADFYIEGTLKIPSTVENEGVTYSVTSIEEEGLAYSDYDTIIIPNKVTTIGDYAFRWCSNLKCVTFSSSVTTIGTELFVSCAKMSAVNVASDNTAFSSVDGVLFNKDKTTLIYCPRAKTGAYTIPNSVTTIGDFAFSFCQGLTSITIPNSVTTIGSSTFEYCHGLTSITIPNSVTNIGNKAFSNCKNLASVTMSKSITSISEELFLGCGLTSFEIPSGVTSIEQMAFYACGELTSLIIPNTVTTIKNGSIRRCRKLESIIIPISVTTISPFAFSENDLLTIYCEAEPTPKDWNSSWNLDDNTVIWGYDPNKKNWTVTLSANNSAYGSVSGGGTVEDSATTTISATPAYSYKFVKWSNGLATATATITVTSDTALVAEFAKDSSLMASELHYEITSDSTVQVVKSDDYKTLKKVVIPETVEIEGKTYTVTSIGKDAFEYCKKITTVSIPNTVVKISSNAFMACDSLVSVDIPNSVTHIGHGVFYGCDNLTSVNIPNSVMSIDNQAFTNCQKLIGINVANDNSHFSSGEGVLFNKDKTELMYFPAGKTGEYSIPNTVTTIADEAFGYCEGLTSINIPNSVKIIKDDAFYGTGLATITIPDGVKIIEHGAFGNCYDLTSATIPNTVTELSAMSFYGCINLTRIDVASGNPNYTSDAGIVFNKDKTEIISFPAGKTDTSYTIPSSVTKIGDNAFYRCEDLKSITIPESVTSIDYEAFENCESLTSITIPNSVTSIGEYAFVDCYKLESIILSESITHINSNVFAWCNKLVYNEFDSAYYLGTSDNPYFALIKTESTDIESLEIHDSCKVIAEGAFYDCANLQYNEYDSVLYLGKAGTPYFMLVKAKSTDITSCEIGNGCRIIGNNAFYNCNKLTSIIIPNGVISIGNLAFDNCRNLTDITIPESVESIGNSAFYYCDNLTSINIPQSVKSIGRYAFYSCDRLKSITIPDSLTAIGNRAFSYCRSLSSVIIPNGVTSIGDWAFSSCSNLAEITIPESVESIGEGAFESCYKLTSLTISSGVRNIGKSAFDGCNKLTTVTIPGSVISIGDEAFDCDMASFYCEAQSKPESWDDNWNPNNRPVVWGFDISKKLFNVTLSANNNDYGSVSGGGITIDGCTATIVAEPAYGCRFVKWSNGLTNITETITVTSDTALVAEFVRENGKTWTVSISQNNSEYGYLGWSYKTYDKVTLDDGSTAYVNGALITISAEPKFGYRFVKWSNGLTNDQETIMITSDTIIVAEFEEIGFTVGLLYYYFTSDTTVEVVRLNDKGITSVIIPETVEIEGKTYSVTSIGSSVFESCSELTSVTIPNTVKSIGSRAFYDCEKLASITIPEQVTTIGTSAFYACDELTSITIPKSVSKIETWAFDECDKLTEINVDSSNMYYSSENGVLFNKDKTELIRCPGGVTGTYTIPDGVTKIGFSAFNSCRDLTSIIMPNTVISIENYAFDNTGITSITIPNSVTSIGSDAFEYCSYLTSVVIPNSVTTIYGEAFYGCHSATIYCESNEKPTGWSNNWNYNWSGNVPVVWGFDPSMKIFNIALSVNYVWRGSVEGPRTASEGSTVTITATPADGCHFVKWSNGLTNATETITVTSDTTIVAEFAEDKKWIVFLLANNIEYGTVTKISGTNLDGSIYKAFATPKQGYNFVKWSNGLTTDTIAITLTSDTTLTAEFAEIVYAGTCGDNARWSYSVASKTLTISGTGSIDRYKTVDLFSTEVNRPWQEVADQIEKVVIGEGITNLGRNAFSYCNNLKEANISSTCDSYGGQSFAYCPNLKKLVVAANSVYQADEYCFSNYDSCTVYVPAGRLDYYKKDIIFGMFKNIVGTYMVIVDADIKNGTVEVESYTIPEGGTVTITPIPDEGAVIADVNFEGEYGYDCHTIYIVNNQYSIENVRSDIVVKVEFSREGDSESGFAYKIISGNNIEITGYKGVGGFVEIPSTITDNGVEYTVTRIGEGAFYNSKADIESITIPSTVTSIGDNAFAYLYLGLLLIPNSVTEIGEGAFYTIKNIIYTGNAKGSPWGALTVNGYGDGKCIFADAEKTHLTAYITNSDSMITTIDIPESVIAIGEYAFTNVWATKIDEGYYIGNEENPYLILWHVGDYFSDSVITSYEIKDGCKYIYYTAFANLEELESVTIPNSVVSIGKLAFYGCDNLKSVNIPDGVVYIGEGAFSDCYELTSITIPQSVTTIDKYAFGNCYKLTITCEVSSKPKGWDDEWKLNDCRVNWADNTAVTESTVSKVNIYAHHNIIVVENATEEIRVYDAMGKLICRDAINRVRAEINVNGTGVYIVKTGATAKRVVVN